MFDPEALTCSSKHDFYIILEIHTVKAYSCMCVCVATGVHIFLDERLTSMVCTESVEEMLVEFIKSQSRILHLSLARK